MPICDCSKMWRILSTLILAASLHSSFTGAEVFGVRLQGGPDRCSGRVEVHYNGSWVSVCGDNGMLRSLWGLAEARVVCRQLGCGDAVGAPADSGCFGPGTGHIWLRDVHCYRGGESFLHQCNHAGIGPISCSHQDDVGVVCGDLRDLPVPSLRRVAPEGSVVRVGDTLVLECKFPLRRCCVYMVTLSRDGGQIDLIDFFKSEDGHAAFAFRDVQPYWHEGGYRCQYSYKDIQHTSLASNTLTIHIGTVPAWVVPVCAPVGGLLLLLLFFTIHSLLKKHCWTS